MLTVESMLKVFKQQSAFGETGKHVHGRGVERADGSYSDEVPRSVEKQDKTGMGPK